MKYSNLIDAVTGKIYEGKSYKTKIPSQRKKKTRSARKLVRTRSNR
jgi:hypothetical protein